MTTELFGFHLAATACGREAVNPGSWVIRRNDDRLLQASRSTCEFYFLNDGPVASGV